MKKILSMFFCIVFSLSLMLIPVNSAEKLTGAAKVSTKSTALNVRTAPNTNSAVKAKLKKGSFVTLIEKSGSYWYVKYGKNKYGYSHSKYLKTKSEDVRNVKTTSGRLRVRAAAAVDSKIKTHLISGETVTVLSQKGNFVRIVYNGSKTGYVNSKYLVKSNNSTEKYSQIILNVPDYKQYDSRWADVTLGNSGQSIKKIGCATTALAMTDSYKAGTTIYPDSMAKKLSYTSGGAVYWPSNYNIVTDKTDYLTIIYNALKMNKPVIVGAKNSYGGQHYVVVTGVKSTDSLSTSDFYINDPGSENRVTLNQFLAAYPIFYKMLYTK